MTNYIAIIHKDEISDYGVSFPDFPGCITAGSTLDEAQANAHEALEAHVGYMIEEGQALPTPRSLEAAIRDTLSENGEGFFATMVVPFEPTAKRKPERVNITVPSRDLARIDRYASEHGYSRSGFLLHAAKLTMQRGA